MFLASALSKSGLTIIYPGLETHPQHELHTKLMNEGFGYGGMLAIDFGTVSMANQVMQRMQESDIGYLAVSLGYFKTLFSCSGKSTSSEIPDPVQQQMGLSKGLVRFSVGIDNNIEDSLKLIIEICRSEGLIN
jgi:methionine-gamma-lyase